MELVKPGIILHSIFGNPDLNPLDPLRFPYFIPCTADTYQEALYSWIDEYLIEGAVQYKRYTRFSAGNGLTIVLKCAQHRCGHVVHARINLNDPRGWELLSGTFHDGHIPGSIPDLLGLRLARPIRHEVDILIQTGLSDTQIMQHFANRYISGLTGDKRRAMESHGGIRVTKRHLRDARVRLRQSGLK